MNRRSHDDLERAVLLARRAMAAGSLSRPEALTRFLYQRWYLGRTGEGAVRPTSLADGAGPARVPAQRGAVGPWRTWNQAWEERTARGADLLRVYLASAPHTSLHVVGAVAAHAQDWEHPWLLSSRAMSQPVPAADATVLYVPLAALPDLRAPLVGLVEDVRPFLAETLPAMTLKIAHGASVAQNTADGRAFGEHRCALIAGTVITHARRSHRETLDRLRSALRRAGIDPHAPYRALGSDWAWEVRKAAVRRAA
jgi:hypothetical protein